MLLITGLTGLSGSAFYEVLCRENYREKIRVVTRRTTKLNLFADTPLNLEIVSSEQGIRDIPFMTEAARGCDTVFHIASKQDIIPVTEAVIGAGSVKNVIFVSSTIVYSQYYPTLHLREDEKACVEQLEQHGIRYVFLRPTMMFGTPRDKNISQFIRWFLKYPIFPVVKHGKATIQPVSRLDVAEAYWMALSHLDCLKEKEYIISGERSMTLMEMFQIICKLAGKKTLFVNIPFPLAKLCVNAVYMLTGRRCDYREKLDRLAEDRAYPHDVIERELGFQPKSFAERVMPLILELQRR